VAGLGYKDRDHFAAVGKPAARKGQTKTSKFRWNDRLWPGQPTRDVRSHGQRGAIADMRATILHGPFLTPTGLAVASCPIVDPGSVPSCRSTARRPGYAFFPA